MSNDKQYPGRSDTSADERFEALWDELAELPQQQPSPRLRQSFYAELERRQAPGMAERLMGWLGFSGHQAWLTATGFAVLGAAVVLLAGAPESGSNRLGDLEVQVAQLNRELILDRLEDAEPGKRLRGVMDAVALAATDPTIAEALLMTASGDDVFAVRTAAIDALGPQLGTDSVGDELIRLLPQSESPLVQLAIINQVLRNGSRAQLDRLLELARDDSLAPALRQHIMESTGRETV